MDLYPSPFQKSKMSLKELAKQAVFILFLIFLTMSFAAIFAIILVPICIAKLLKKLGKFCMT